jgi:O-acetyl-ADP-ribose deacetylase (regulator of RNase III)
MITYLETSVFESPAQTLVNTVNTVGVMGKGIAKEFKSRYPAMYREYRALCDQGRLDVGNLHLWRNEKRWVLNFPTKTTWKLPSKMEYVERGLQKFVEMYARLGITSASFPPLGCGNGNLQWAEVRPLMEHYLKRTNIAIYIHDVQVGHDFVAEHVGKSVAPENFEDFWRDVVAVLQSNKGLFQTSRDGFYRVSPDLDGALIVESSGGRRRIDRELVEESWISLRDKTLSNQNYASESARKLKSYLFPIIAELPYVVKAQVRHPNTPNSSSEGLFINRENLPRFENAKPQATGQLWQSL